MESENEIRLMSRDETRRAMIAGPTDWLSKEISMVHRLATFFVVVFLTACGPTLVLPGGTLSGTTAKVPSDWTSTNDVSTIQLETRPESPYSVNIWAVGMGDQLYVHAGANRSAWVENMEANANVRVRIEGTLYDLAASRVEDQAEFDAFSDSYETKYGARPRNENVAEAYLYRLRAR